MATAISILSSAVYSCDIFVFNLFHSILSLPFHLIVLFCYILFGSIILKLCKSLSLPRAWNICGLYQKVLFQNGSWILFLCIYFYYYFWLGLSLLTSYIISLCRCYMIILIYLYLTWLTQWSLTNFPHNVSETTYCVST